jgi:hypothetical protein
MDRIKIKIFWKREIRPGVFSGCQIHLAYNEENLQWYVDNLNNMSKCMVWLYQRIKPNQ